jgi:hypothetical protein
MKKLFIVLAILVAMNANGQWSYMGHFTYSGVYSLGADSNYLYAGTSSDGIFRTSLNNSNWSSMNNGLQYNNGIYGIVRSSNKLFAASHFDGLYVKYDSVSNWQHYDIVNFPFKPTGLYAIGTNVYMITMDPAGVFTSTNNGIFWRFGTPGESGYCLSFGTCGDYLFAGTASGIYRSALDGRFWSQMNNGLNYGWIESIVSTGNTVFIGTFQGGVFRSTNFGQSWEPKGLSGKIVNALLVYNLILLAGTNDGVYVSSNNGESWTSFSQGLNNMVIYSLLKAGNYIYAGTGDLIWRRSLSEIIGIQNISTETPSKYSLGQNYPNPFNSMCNLQFTMYNAGLVKLVVYDVQGREVQTLVNERLQPGTYETSFDGSMLNSGVYFYRLMTKDFSETKRMLLIK